METITMNIDAALYHRAENYARRHRTNVQRLVERCVLTLLSDDEAATSPQHKAQYTVKPLEELPLELQSLVGIARKEGVTPTQDLNGRDVREEYLSMKYGK